MNQSVARPPPPPTTDAPQPLDLNQLHAKVLFDGLYFLLSTAKALLLSQFGAQQIGMKCRIATARLAYGKAVRLSLRAMCSTDARTGTSVGQMVGLISNDIGRFDQALPLLPMLVLAPLKSLVLLAILYSYSNIATISSLMLMLVVYIATQSIIGQMYGKQRSRLAKRSDARVRLMGDALSSIKVIKMYDWTQVIANRLDAARRRETRALARTTAIKTLSEAAVGFVHPILIFGALAFFLDPNVASEQTLEFIVVLICSVRSLWTTLPLRFVAAAIECAELVIACKRVDHFMGLPELASSAERASNRSEPMGPLVHNSTLNRSLQFAVQASNVCASWSHAEPTDDGGGGGSDRCVLDFRCLNFRLRHGQLCTITGRIGSGKTSLLLALLGELPLRSGSIEINGRVAYASQEAWLFPGSIRANILLCGRTLDADRYQRVLRACSLEADTKQLTRGDLTEVGDGGAALSGGQRARVNLARALYEEADIYLLDEPLAALGARGGEHVLEQAARGYLRHKTVLLATGNPPDSVADGRTSTRLDLSSHCLAAAAAADALRATHKRAAADQGRDRQVSGSSFDG